MTHVKHALALAGWRTLMCGSTMAPLPVDHEARVSAGRLIAALEQAGYEATPRPS